MAPLGPRLLLTNPFLDRRAWLDMDVVDTTWIENNVQVPPDPPSFPCD